MKAWTRNLLLLPTIIGALGLILADSGMAQTFKTLHSFTTGGYVSSGKYTNSDGANPIGRLVLSGKTLYGTAQQGGSSGDGTVFALNTDGTAFTNLHTFYYRGDGAYPAAGLILSRSTLYGAAQFAGSAGAGTVFKLHTDGTAFTTLHDFTAASDTTTNTDGGYPLGELILSGATLYGTAAAGAGTSYRGMVFKVKAHGRGFMPLHTFTIPDIYSSTNSDGANPEAGLTLSGKILYGTARRGGNSDNGTVFALKTDGTAFATLHSFTATSSLNPPFTNSDGAGPIAGVILSGNALYGTTYGGGNSGNGTVFKVNTDGTGFTTLHYFTALSGIDNGTNSDGANPWGGLALSGNTLYGTASHGGSSANGTVFALNTDGTGFVTLHSFTVRPYGSANGDGAYPHGLILSDNILYGTTYEGGDSGNGTAFSISLPETKGVSPAY